MRAGIAFMILIKKISAAINRSSMKLLSFVFIISISWMSVSGQNTRKKKSKSDGTILLKVADVFGEHQFYVDTYQKQSESSEKNCLE